MKRSGFGPRTTPMPRPTSPIERRTPLRTTKPTDPTAIPAGSGVARGSSPKRSGPIKAKRRVATDAEKVARHLVAARSGGVCEGCGHAPATDWSHRVPRDVGPWTASNGLHLCNDLAASIHGGGSRGRGCHSACHAFPLWAQERGWVLLRSQDPLTSPVWLPAYGRVLLGDDGTIHPYETEDVA